MYGFIITNSKGEELDKGEFNTKEEWERCLEFYEPKPEWGEDYDFETWEY